MPRLLDLYKDSIVEAMIERFGYKNRLAVPRLEKIAINMGVGKGAEERTRLEAAAKDLMALSGQKPIMTRAKQSVAGFKIRQGVPVGLKVTLRGLRMYEFLDRLISVALPRIRDFRGLSSRSFDERGNYSLGLGEQSVFPEVDIDHLQYVQGMDITVCISDSSPEESRELLGLFGMPFRRQEGGMIDRTGQLSEYGY